MKPILRYYGGKQKMLEHIIPLIPDHKVYGEPFAGGATVLFAKKKSSVEVINDTLDSLVNFYRIVQHKDKVKVLLQMCKQTAYARSEHTRAVELYKSGSGIEKAWAFWFKISTGFSGKLDGGFSTTKIPGSSPCIRFQNYKKDLEYAVKRIENIQIENIDAIECIRRFDSEDTFFYIDPPYLDADQGHYSGYTTDNFFDLLKYLSIIKGKYLLSCYPGKVIDHYLGIHSELSYSKIVQRISAANRTQSPEAKRVKTEMLIWNYNINNAQGYLFDE